ncbi:purine-binding chemotaxis protein CheW [Desulfonispora thiosulfatigenes DSM 11270]|uniref:Purine-binding chemotaxis protein CheW n=1 Tax=Desulfonispora thiosulfatigenes DSM 11270 TaxID=656914 RepID=A0A1W1UL72_DESTI|nr:chemotaxis protein CheW [Desulfonispora thiosulfatigenes]SMB81810.1 purine-binding chemotaxis protein CheW [Desulfonispora thiosulfatigenes DSM 11270]
MQIVVFGLGKEQYALDIQYIQEIVSLQETTKIPNMPDYIEGVVNFRGRIIPVIDLAKKFNFDIKDQDDSARLIVLEFIKNKPIAIKTDYVNEVLTIDDANIENPPKLDEQEKEHCVKGIIKNDDRLIILLDHSKIITAEMMPELDIE